MLLMCMLFSQAEDGIRDDLGNGVQAWALPIWRVPVEAQLLLVVGLGLDVARHPAQGRLQGEAALQLERAHRRQPEIGRASCRERVQISVFAVSLKKKD